MIALYVALAGGVGAAARAWIDGAVTARVGGHRLPWGTALINLSGSLLIGLIAGFGVSFVPEAWQEILTVGFLGGYTTFSTAAVQTAEMFLERRWRAGLGYGLGLLIAAAVCAGLGLWLGRVLGALGAG